MMDSENKEWESLPGFAKDEIKRLRMENRRLTRELRLADSKIDRITKNSVAVNNLSVLLTTQKAKQEDYMNVFLRNCPDIIILFDQYNHIVFCTKAFLDAAHIANFESIKGRTLSYLFSGKEMSDYIEVLEEETGEVLTKKQERTLNMQIALYDSVEAKDYQIHISPVEYNDGSSGVLAIFSDLTELLREKRKAEAANEAKSQFLAKMSHEIRTPMNAIIGITDILLRTGVEGKHRGHVLNINKSANALLGLINDILDFSRIEAGKLELRCEVFDFEELLNNVYSVFGMMFKGKNIDFAICIDSNVPKILYGDEFKIRQILMNLLNNALKYTLEGYVKFRVSWNLKEVIFAVEDSGIGIKEEDLPSLFDPFVQVAEHKKNLHFNGSGLGLAITHNLCTMMGGSISVVSHYGEGSVFTVCLPLEGREAWEQPLANSDEPGFLAVKAKVLVVDDIEINLLVVAELLKTFGIEADLAAGGGEAVKMASSQEYDLIFMDHMMPEMDGVEALRRIRRAEYPYNQIPVIALTANAVVGAKEMFLEHGFNDFISKPIEYNILSSCLMRWLPKEKVHRLDAKMEDTYSEENRI